MPAIAVGNSYDKYSSEHRLERRLVDGFLGALDRALPRARPAQVLEVGTGEGVISQRVADRFPESFVVGVDLPASLLVDEWARRELHGVFGDVVSLPFPADAFDLVLAIEVLEHVEDPDAALSEIARVGSGPIVLSVPHEPWWRAGNMARGRYLRQWGNTPGHLQHWSRQGFVDLVARHLRVEAVASPFPWTMVVASARPARTQVRAIAPVEEIITERAPVPDHRQPAELAGRLDAFSDDPDAEVPSVEVV